MARTQYWIPKFLGDSDRLAFGFSSMDIIVTVGVSIVPPVFIWLYAPFEIPTLIKLVLLITGLTLGGVIFRTTPEDYSVVEWISSVTGYTMNRKHVPNIDRGSGTDDSEQKDAPKTDQVRVYEMPRRTQDLTMVDRVHVDDHVIERIDGAYVGGVRVSGVNLAFADRAEKEQVVGNFAKFLNDNEHPLQVFATTEPFAFEDHVNHYNDRQSDQDIQELPILEELLFSYRTGTLKSTGSQGKNTRQYYILSPVTESATKSKDRNVTWKERLSNLPIFERFINADTPSESEAHEEHVDEVQRRVSQVKSGIESVEGLHATELSANELTLLQSEFWTGRNHDHLRADKNTVIDAGDDLPLLRDGSVVASES
jgi:hypothetical protein